jgi:OmpA-OmpF porin, OOP family
MYCGITQRKSLHFNHLMDRPMQQKLGSTLRKPILLIVLSTLCLMGYAQSDVLKGAQVTEANLIAALTPAPSGITTRSLEVSREHTLTPARRRASASLLITFDTNSANLTEPAKQQLSVVAAALQNERLSHLSFNVEGHADRRGHSSSNLTLSQRRAQSVRAYLVSRYSIAQERLNALGKGDHEPANFSMIAAPENRRVTIVTHVGQ